jgi:hypothetical protein
VLPRRNQQVRTGPTDQPPKATRTVRTSRHRERLKRNMVYRRASNRGNQCTSVQRGLDRTTGDEEYVLVPDGNIVSLAT